MFNECDILTNLNCLQDNQFTTPKNQGQAEVIMAFFKLFKEDLNGLTVLNELDAVYAEIMRRNKVMQKKIDATTQDSGVTLRDLEAEAKKDRRDLASVNIKEAMQKVCTFLGQNEALTANCTGAPQKFDKLTLYVAASEAAVAFILLYPKEDGARGQIIRMGSRLLNSSEKGQLLPVKIAHAILFFMQQCNEITCKENFTILVDDPCVADLFGNPKHSNYFPQLEHIGHDFITINGGNPAAMLLLTRQIEPK